jgi:hypothetical protein
MYRDKRWRTKYKAAELDPNYPIDPEVLKNQEEATAKLNLIYREIDDQEVLGGNGLHDHICTFKMLSNDKTRQARQCREWLKKHPIEYPDNNDFLIWEPCDFCAMMNYVAQDDEGKIMYVSRTFPEPLKKCFEKE